MSKLLQPYVVNHITFSKLPHSGSWLGKVDGYYGYAYKNGIIKPIRHSKLKEQLDKLCCVDFIYIPNICT